MSLSTHDAKYLSQFAVRIATFQSFAPELARIVEESGPQAARDWTEKNFPSNTRNELNNDLDALGQYYADRSAKIYVQIGNSIDRTAMLMSLFAGLAVLLAFTGSYVIARGIARPLASITRVTERVAAGDASVSVPFSERRDE